MTGKNSEASLLLGLRPGGRGGKVYVELNESQTAAFLPILQAFAERGELKVLPMRRKGAVCPACERPAQV